MFDMLSSQIQLYKGFSCLHWVGNVGSVAQTSRHYAMANHRGVVSMSESNLRKPNPPIIGLTNQEIQLDKSPELDEAVVPSVDILLCVDQEEDGYIQGGEFETPPLHQKNILSCEEVENIEHQKDCRPMETPFTDLIDLGLINEPEAHLLEEVDQTVLSNRILALSRRNKIRSALEYLRSMELLGLCPTIHACNSLISSLLRNGLFDDCLKVFDFTRRRKIITGHTYSLMLTGLANAQGFHSTLKFFKESGSEYDNEKNFDAVVYNTMISICGRFHEWSEVERIWRNMKVNRCAGNEVTYRMLVNSFVQCGQVELALDAYFEMVQNGFAPRTGTMDAIISGCAKEGKWDSALNVFQKMVAEGYYPNLATCNALINSLGKAGKLKLAFGAYDAMKSLGHEPDAYTFNALLNALNKASMHFDALQLFEKIEENEKSQLNVHVYNTVLVSCSKLRLWDRALQILYRMEAQLAAVTVSYNLVIKACERARKPKIALEVYEHMVYQKCKPDVFTYMSLVRCCIWGDLWEELEEILNAATPDISLYNTAVQGLYLRGKINLANKIYNKMRESGLQPDGKTRALMLQKLPKAKGTVINK